MHHFARALSGLLVLFPLLAPCPGLADEHGPRESADALVAQSPGLEARVVAWRRDFHQHPELSNRETRTAGVVEKVLRELGLEVRPGIAHTGVVGVLKGGRPGPVVALRADMDALPVTEDTGLPFASVARANYAGREVGVMHACGHDAHMAILLGAAEVLSRARAQVPGTVLFVFQPAEEGAPAGEEGGAKLMLKEGVFDDPKPDAAFALHVVPQHEVGEIALRGGGVMAGSNRLQIRVRGRQTHAAYPWLGVDPVAVASRIVLALQAIPARRVDNRTATVVSFGAIHGGVRHNIIPDEVQLLGTIRHLDPEVRDDLFDKIRSTAEKIAESAGAVAEVEIPDGYPITWNDPALTERARVVLAQVVDADRLITPTPRTGAEDFAFFARETPGSYFWLGVRPPGTTLDEVAPNHSPHFLLNEDAMLIGVRAFVQLVLSETARP